MSEVRITDPKTGGQKGQKTERFDLIPYDALEEVARVYGVGAKKYEDDNWLKGYRWRLSAGALARHFARFMLGEERDPETGCLHLAHAAWHCLTLITFYMRRLGTDDRAPPKALPDAAVLDAVADAIRPSWADLATTNAALDDVEKRVAEAYQNGHAAAWIEAHADSPNFVPDSLPALATRDFERVNDPRQAIVSEPDPYGPSQ